MNKHLKSKNDVTKVKSDKLLYIYVKYEDDTSGKMYCYTSDDNNVKKGDRVLVDRAGNEATARVINVKYYNESEAPYPYEKTKKIKEIISDEYEIDSDEGYYFYDDLEEKCEEYHNFVLNNMFGRLSIIRLMKLLVPTQGEDKLTLYYYPKFNCFFYKDKEAELYSIAEYENELLDEQIFRIIENDSIEVYQFAFDELSNEEVYYNARKFCIDNNIVYHDDTDILEYTKEKSLFDDNNKEMEKPQKFNSVNEIKDYLKNYKPAEYTFPDPKYYLENNKIIHYMGWLQYDLRVFNILDYLRKYEYINIKYYDNRNYPQFFEENWKEWNLEKLDYERLSYLLFRSFYTERMNEGLINSMALDGTLLKLVERAEYLKNDKK